MFLVVFYFEIRITFRFNNFESADTFANLLNESYPEAIVDVICPSGYKNEV